MVAGCATGSSFSFGGTGACCAASATFVSASASCTPSTALTAGPADTALYLSGSSAEGAGAFVLTGEKPAFAAGPFGAANDALTLKNTFLSAPGARAPEAMPSGGNVAWTASAWVKCAAPKAGSWASVLGWGASGDDGDIPKGLTIRVSEPAGGAVTTLTSGIFGFGLAAMVLLCLRVTAFSS